MKKCLNCGAENKDENTFCSTCGGSAFSDIIVQEPGAVPPVPPVPPAPGQAPVPPVPPPPYIRSQPVKKPFGIFDVLTILGFVSSLVGLFSIWVVLEPLAVLASVVGFFKGGRFKGLAAAGIVISIIAFIIILFQTLYDGNIIGKWAIEGALNR